MERNRAAFRALDCAKLLYGGAIWSVSFLLGSACLISLLTVPLCCWFTANLFVTSLLFWLGFKWIKNEVILASLLSGISWLIPEGMEYLKFFIPFFGIGVIFRRYDMFERETVPGKVLAILTTASVVALILWKPEYSIYLTKCPTVYEYSAEKILAYGMRLLTGVLITLSFIQLLNRAKMIKSVSVVLRSMSKNSLGLYVVHYLILSNYAKKIDINLSEPLLDIAMGMLTIGIIYVLTKLFELIRRNEIGKFVILGEK